MDEGALSVQNVERSLKADTPSPGASGAEAAPFPPRPRMMPASAAGSAASVAAPIGQWCSEHDERNSFVFIYITASVVLSLMAGLFWLVMLVGVHFGLELYRNRRLAPRTRLAHATFGIKLDVTLVLLALALSLYMDLLFAVLGLRALPRAGAAVGRLGGRLPSVRRVIRAALLLTDEVVRVGAYFAAARGISTAAPSEARVRRSGSPWTEHWSLGTRLVIGLGACALFLLLAGPWLSGNGVDGTLAILVHELSPFAR
jgi:hypothetical protein